MKHPTVWRMNKVGPDGKRRAYWYAAWPCEETGRRLRKSLGSAAEMTRDQALLAAADVYRERDEQKVARKVAHAQVGRLVEGWLEDLDVAPKTLTGYRARLDHLVEYLGGDRLVSRVTTAEADGYRAWLRRQGQSDFSAAACVRLAKVVFKRARRHGVIQADPFADVPLGTPQGQANFRYVTPQELEKMLDAAPDRATRMAVALARLGGLRFGEIARLGWAHVDWDRRIMAVNADAERDTTKVRTRQTPMMPRLYALMREAYESAPAGSFGPCDGLRAEKYLYPLVWRMYAAAGLPKANKPFHDLRKSLVSQWETEAIAPVSAIRAWLGHTHKVAERFYFTVLEESVRGVVAPQTAHQ